MENDGKCIIYSPIIAVFSTLYPLANVYIANVYIVSWESPLFQWPFSIAMLDYQRGNGISWDVNGISYSNGKSWDVPYPRVYNLLQFANLKPWPLKVCEFSHETHGDFSLSKRLPEGIENSLVLSIRTSRDLFSSSPMSL